MSKNSHTSRGKNKTESGSLKLPTFRIEGEKKGQRKAETIDAEGEIEENSEKHGRGEFPEKGGISFTYLRDCQEVEENKDCI